jgi:putative DNA primase/helicase
MKTETALKLDYALKYADLGWRVIWSHWPIGIGASARCSCKEDDPTHGIGKHPIGLEWQKRATTEKDVIRAWFSAKEEANVSIVTGTESGIFVLDIDGAEGLKTLRELEAKYGSLPVTVMFITGSGGLHYVFKHPGTHIPTKASIAHKIDVRGDGGQIIAAPSRHVSGGTYRLDPNAAPRGFESLPQVVRTVDVSEAPHWLLSLIVSSSPSSEHGSSGPRFDIQAALNGAPAGRRDETIFKLASKMRHEDIPLEMALDWIRRAAENCTPPFSIEVAEEKVHRAYEQYDAGVRWEKALEAGSPEDRQANVERARGIVTALSERAKADKFAPFEPETLGALALVKDENPAEWMRTREELKKQGISLGELDRAVKDQKKKQRGSHLRLVKPGEPPPLHTTGQMIPDAPVPDLVIPDDYALRSDATIRVTPSEQGMLEHVVAYAPILITGRLRDEDENVEYLRLAFRRSGRWYKQTVDRGIALDSKRLVALASQSFPVSSETVKDVVRYVHHLEAANHDRLPCQRVSSHLGWQGNGGDAGFLWGHEHLAPEDWTEGPISFHGLDGGDEQIAAAYHAEGTLEGWLEGIKPLAHYPRVLLALYAAFVPPLLPILKAPNFIVDWANRTSTGKTTALRVAASVWGNPDERSAESALGTWDATRVYVERASAVLSGIPLLLDDTSRAKYPRIVADLLYTVASGHGRGRGNKTSLATTRTWRTVMLSTGESPATSFTQDGGTRMRCLEVRGVPFGKEDAETRQVVDQLNRQILSNYGHAGPTFVRHLLKERDNWSALPARYRAAVEYYAAKNGRLAHYMAAIHVAAEVVHQVFDLPWCHGEKLVGLWAAIAGEVEDAAPEIRALRDIVSWANAHTETFYGRHQIGYAGADQQPQPRVSSGGWSGKWEVDAVEWDLNAKETWHYIAFYPTVLDRNLRELKYEPAAIRAAWKERGWLECEKDRDTTKKYIEGEHVRLVVIRRTAIEEADA